MTTQLISSTGQQNPQFGVWNIANEYLAGDVVINNGNVYQANDNIPAGTPFSVGTTGATWAVTVLGSTSSTSISNGTSNVDIATEDGNITMSANSQSNIITITSNGSHATTDIVNDVNISGNLVVQGNTTYVNVTSQVVTDPIADLGVGANNTILVSNDNKDRGVAMHTYGDGATYTSNGSTPLGNTFIELLSTTGISIGMEVGIPSTPNDITHGTTVTTVNAGNIEISAPTTAIIADATGISIGRDLVRFMGWHVANSEFVLASDTSIDGTNNVTINTLGNTRVGNLTATQISMTAANANILLSTGNISLGNVANIHIANGSNGQFLQTDGNGNLAWASASIKVTLDTSSTTKPTDPLSGDTLVVTDTGLYDGVVQEEWVYDGEDWVQVIGTPPVSGSVIDNTIADSDNVSVIGTYIVPAADTLNAFVGEENNFAAYDGSGFTFSTPTDGTVQLINTGPNAGQLWKYDEATTTWATVNGGALTTYNWVQTYSYAAGSLVIYNGQLYQANGNVPANTAWSTGTTGATWKAVSSGGAYNAQTFTATAGQTAFTPLTQTPVGAVSMYINGMMINASAVTVAGTTATYIPANNGAYALTAGDLVTITYMYGAINTNLVNAEFNSHTGITSGSTTTSATFADIPGGSFTLPSAGTWRIDYSCSLRTQKYNAGIRLVDSGGNVVPNSSSFGGYEAGAAANTNFDLDGDAFVTTTGSTVYKLQWAVSAGTATIYNDYADTSTVSDSTGDSYIRWQKISGFTPITALTSTTTSFGNITTGDIAATGTITGTSILAVPNWTSAGTITFGATTTAPTIGTVSRNIAQYKRVGPKTYQVQLNYYQTVAGGNGSGDYLFTLPAGLSFDTTLVTQTLVSVATGASTPDWQAQALPVSSGTLSDGSTICVTVGVVPYSATQYRIVATQTGGVTKPWGSAYYQLGQTVAQLRLQFEFQAA